jgi:arsenate reductase-like glutaredoxin family protein
MDIFRRRKESPMTESKPTVVLYCTPWCPSCRLARSWLRDHGISYEEVDISRDRAAAARVRGWADGNETTPTFDIRGTVLVDWDEEQLEALLAQS